MRKTIIIALLTMVCHHAGAQYVTYNHDNTKMNQVTVMETGAGSLTPALYYNTVHNKYQKDAAVRNKLAYRTEASASLYLQVTDAEKIDSALTSRAKIEALNMADRNVDLAWQAEGPKIEDKMHSFIDNINRIIPTGGSAQERGRWMEYYNLFQTAVTSIRGSYLPNSERKSQYLSIYQDLCRQNELLVSSLVIISKRNSTSTALNATLDRNTNTATIARSARERWKQTVSSNTITE